MEDPYSSDASSAPAHKPTMPVSAAPIILRDEHTEETDGLAVFLLSTEKRFDTQAILLVHDGLEVIHDLMPADPDHVALLISIRTIGSNYLKTAEHVKFISPTTRFQPY
jgi:hypothetical protein